MKVIAKKVFYEVDLYHYPDENMSYGLFSLEVGTQRPLRRDPELIYSKGDFKEWKFRIEEICCTSMKLAIEAERITFQEPIHLEFNDKNSEKKFEFPIQSVFAFIACACWPVQLMQMHYCHFCGKKIEIEEEK